MTGAAKGYAARKAEVVMPGENDAYKPAEIAALIETAGVAKAALPLDRMATLAMLAGAFIGFGSAFWCMPWRAQTPVSGHNECWAVWSLPLG